MLGLLNITGASFEADGHDGSTLFGKGSGGGSGGGLFLHGYSIVGNEGTVLSAAGGDGGNGGEEGPGGGGGGGGRIALLYNDFGDVTTALSYDRSGGAEGAGFLIPSSPGSLGSLHIFTDPDVGIAPEPGAASAGLTALGGVLLCASRARVRRGG